MRQVFRRLALGLGLIAAASAVLLLSDLGSRHRDGARSSASASKSVAILQHASQAILDDGRQGMLQGLAERGWVEGRNLRVRNYNAEGDMPVAQAIARQMAAGGSDLLLSISTPSLQAVANANRASKVPHVFALVTDPVAAGVGIGKDNPLDHPAWMTGYGTLQPVAQAFRTALEMNPQLKNVGVVWNVSEANSEAQVKIARKVCADLGLNLLEATVENSAGVAESAASLAARGADAIWVNGDVTVITAIDSVVAAANKAGIPVFTVIPPNVKRGALFDLGADYHEVGRLAGVMAGEILSGKNPAAIPVTNVLPETQTLNLAALKGLKAQWTIPDDVRKRAKLIIDENGVEHAAAASPAPVAAAPVANPSGRKWKIAIVSYNESPPAEETLAGMNDAWNKSPLVAGQDYEIKMQCAQGDMSALGGLLDAAVSGGADIIVPMSTPTLQAALHKVKDLPIVFTLVASPVAVGAGKSDTDHPPNITGVAVMGPYPEMLDLLEKYFPQYKRIGTLFCPAEANSVNFKNAFEDLCRKRGFTLETVAANSPAEFADAALSLVSRPIDAVVQIPDNISSASFTALTRAARQARKPLLSLNSTTAPLGAAVALGRDYHDGGVTTVRLLEKIIGGESPAHIPFTLPPKSVLVVSPANAEAVGMTLPPGLVKAATKVLN